MKLGTQVTFLAPLRKGKGVLIRVLKAGKRLSKSNCELYKYPYGNKLAKVDRCIFYRIGTDDYVIVVKPLLGLCVAANP